MSRGRERFYKYKNAIRLLCKLYSLFPHKIQVKLLEKNRNSKGYIGQVKRYALLKNLAKSIGDNVSIKEGVYLYNTENLNIGDNVSIWPMVYIDAYGGIDIGNDVSIAHSASILSFEHTFKSREIQIKDQEVVSLPVKIHDNIWIGAKATILGGTKVCTGCVIGAGSVVTRDTNSNAVYCGVPAKKIKDR